MAAKVLEKSPWLCQRAPQEPLLDVHVDSDGSTLRVQAPQVFQRVVELREGSHFDLEDVLQLVVMRRRPELRFIHASSVYRGNCAALFVGQSMSGKSTIAAALEGSGFNVLCDDVTPVDFSNGFSYSFFKRGNKRSKIKGLEGTPSPLPATITTEVGKLVKYVFFLDHSNKKVARRIDVNGALQEWHTIYRECIGEPLPAITKDIFIPEYREEDFSQVPILAPLGNLDALRKLLQHVQNPRPALTTMLRESVAFLEKTEYKALCTGPIAMTADLLTEYMELMR